MWRSPPKRPSLNLNFKVSGKAFSVKKSQLLEKLGLFQADGSLLNAEDYEVKTKVPESVFAEFVQMIEGGKITVSEETWKPLKLLSEEFDCEILANECAAVAKSHSLDFQTTIESLIDSLSKRICVLEEKSLFQEQGLEMVQNSIQSLFNRIGSFESEIRRISEICGGLDNRLSGQIRVLESEKAALGARVGGLESLEQRHGQLIEEVKAENKALLERVGGLESLEQSHGRLIEKSKRETRLYSRELRESSPVRESWHFSNNAITSSKSQYLPLIPAALTIFSLKTTVGGPARTTPTHGYSGR
jgi:ribosome-associated translation inhibitor RaiA